jgi:hypothetical protein
VSTFATTRVALPTEIEPRLITNVLRADQSTCCLACRTIEDHDTLFVLAEVAHFVGIGLLGFKMYSKRSAAGAQPTALSQQASSMLGCWAVSYLCQSAQQPPKPLAVGSIRCSV